jgi:AAA+ ATPase superfamily predicted ATPase
MSVEVIGYRPWRLREITKKLLLIFEKTVLHCNFNYYNKNYNERRFDMTDFPLFVGRTSELKLLDELYASNKSEFLVLYGRSRVGKTRLLTEWLTARKIKPILFVCEQDSKESLLRQFSQIIYKKAFPSLPIPDTFTFANWDQVWNQIGELAKQERLVVFIDEFTYMMAADPTLSSNLQRAWDAILENTNIFLCISGSQLRMMVRGILSGTAPLYRRTTAKMELKPLPFGITKSYFERYSPTERVMLYSVFGGIPHYWRLIDQNKSISDNIKRLLLSPGSNLKDEPRILLNDYISEPNNYIAILRAIANGYATPKEIENFTGIPNLHLSQYISNLASTGYVVKKLPATASPSSRAGRQVITDPFLRFYYRFIHSRLTQLEMGEVDQILEELKKHMVDYIGTYTCITQCIFPLFYPTKKCAACSGFTVRHVPDSLCGLFRIHCAACSGFTVRHAPDFAV